MTWPSQQAASTVELSFLVPVDEVGPWEVLSEDFQREHPDIEINIVTNRQRYETTDVRKNAYTLDFELSSAQYDLVYMDTVWTPDFAGRLIDLNDWVQRDEVDLSVFLESELAAGSFEGGLYRLPMRADIGLLYYRQDLLEEIEMALPSTLDELEQVSNLLMQRPDVEFGYLWQSSAYEGLITTFVEVMNGFGGQWIDLEDSQVGLSQPETVAAAELLRSLIQKGISPAIENSRQPFDGGLVEQSSLEAFMNEGSVFLRGWPSFWSALMNDEQHDWKNRVKIALPFSFTQKESVGCRGGWGFGIPTNAAHPNQAWTAIEYFTSEAAQKKFVLASGFLPSRRSLFEDEEVRQKYPHMPQMLNYLENSSVSRPVIPNYGEAAEVLRNALSDVIDGDRSASEAMDEAQTKTSDVLRRSSVEAS
ncbi:MAG: extracellular solute-binding protein [Cyanobacteria bacterium P01_D01_bin.1]